MLNHSELAVIKDGILTLDGHSCSKIYRLLGMCCNPGRYQVSSSKSIEDLCWVSDGSNVWMEHKEPDLNKLFKDKPELRTVVTNKYTKEELISLRDSIATTITNSTRYYDIDGRFYRTTKDSLYYLNELRYSGGTQQYKEAEIPMYVIDKILKHSVPITNKTDTLIYNDRRVLISQDRLIGYHENNNMQYFGYTSLDGYYVRLDFDQVINIEMLDENNTFDCLKISFNDIKELIVIDYLKEEENT